MAGSIAQDTDKMASWGLSDVIYMALENEKEKQEHEREMEKLKSVQQINQTQQTAENTSSGSSNLLNNDLIKYGGVVVVGLIAYKLLA